MSLPLVTVSQRLVATFEGQKEPGFEMEINATYRDLPDAALVQLEKVLASGLTQMADYGEQQLQK